MSAELDSCSAARARSPAPRRPAPGEDAPLAIKVEGLVSSFDENTVHDGLDLEVRKGEILGLVGGSGAGKSVLLNTLIGLRHPQGGKVEVLGVDVERGTAKDIRDLESRWGVLFQNGALFSALSVRENVSAPLFEHARLPRGVVADIADMKLALAGLEPRAGDLRPAELSGGMRKRAGLARAIALDPELLFLDEPTAGLDPISAEAFDVLIRELSDALGPHRLHDHPRSRQPLRPVRPGGGDRRQEGGGQCAHRRTRKIRPPVDQGIFPGSTRGRAAAKTTSALETEGKS